MLCYHAVSDQRPAALAVTRRRLEEQVLFLAGRGSRARTFFAPLAGRTHLHARNEG